jgi:hypothetical protein
VSVGFTPSCWHYTSPEVPITNTPTMQTIELFRTGEIAVGSYLRINLRGRYQTQPGEDPEKYYTVLQCVCALGVVHGALRDRPVLADALTELALRSDEFTQELTRRAAAEGYTGLPPHALVIREAILWSEQAAALLSELDEAKAKRITIERMLKNGEITKALRVLCALPPFHELRGSKTLQMLRESRTSRSEPLLWTYLKALAGQSKLNAEESIAFVECSANAGQIQLCTMLFMADRFTASEALGDTLLRKDSFELAINVFARAGVNDKLIDTLASRHLYDEVVRFCMTTGYHPDWPGLLTRAIGRSPREAALRFGMLLLDPNEGSEHSHTLPRAGLPIETELVLSALGVRMTSGVLNPVAAIEAEIEKFMRERHAIHHEPPAGQPHSPPARSPSPPPSPPQPHQRREARYRGRYRSESESSSGSDSSDEDDINVTKRI